MAKQTFLGKKCPNTIETRNQEKSRLFRGGGEGGQDNLDSILNVLFPVLLFEKGSVLLIIDALSFFKKPFFTLIIFLGGPYKAGHVSEVRAQKALVRQCEFPFLSFTANKVSLELSHKC